MCKNHLIRLIFLLSLSFLLLFLPRRIYLCPEKVAGKFTFTLVCFSAFISGWIYSMLLGYCLWFMCAPFPKFGGLGVELFSSEGKCGDLINSLEN